jgi:hypothetical protein
MHERTLTFDVDAESTILAQGRRYADHLRTMSHQAYGPDVGVPRILNLLADLDARRPSSCQGELPSSGRGWRQPLSSAATRSRHSYCHRAPTSLTAVEERDDCERD